MITTNSIGVACCGNCGSELTIVCTGGCPEPDIQFRDNPTATLRIPHDRVNPEKAALGICNVGRCKDPVAPKEHSKGRPPTKCPRHLQLSRAADARGKARKVAPV